jgi:hypothetical protein
MHCRHQQVRHHFVALELEVMLGEPQRVPSVPVHQLRDRLGLGEHAGEVLVGIAPLVGRRGVLAAVGQIDVAGIDGGEFADHAVFLPLLPAPRDAVHRSLAPFPRRRKTALIAMAPIA